MAYRVKLSVPIGTVVSGAHSAERASADRAQPLRVYPVRVQVLLVGVVIVPFWPLYFVNSSVPVQVPPLALMYAVGYTSAGSLTVPEEPPPEMVRVPIWVACPDW
jgi:hypothetical protein